MSLQRGGLLAGVALVAGMVGWLVGETGSRESAATTIADAEGTSPVSSLVETTVMVTTTTTTRSLLAPIRSLNVLPGASSLKGLVAVAPHPNATGESPLWMLNSSRAVQRLEIPLAPGDYPYPLIMADRRVVFVDFDSAYVVDVDLNEAPVAVSDGGFLVPGGSSDLVWIIESAAQWVAALDVRTGDVSERVDVSDVIGFPEAGVADGLIVRPVDETTYGRVAYWTPTLGLEPIESIDPESALLGSSGDVAVFASVNGTIEVVDVANNHLVSRLMVDVGEDPIVEGCLSPERTAAAFTANSGTSVVVDLEDGDVIYSSPPDEFYDIAGWTSIDQLIVITGAEGEQILQAVDPFTGSVNNVARLTGPGSWWATAANSNCRR
jgi:hypothetical protein